MLARFQKIETLTHSNEGFITAGPDSHYFLPEDSPLWQRTGVRDFDQNYMYNGLSASRFFDMTQNLDRSTPPFSTSPFSGTPSWQSDSLPRSFGALDLRLLERYCIVIEN